MGRKQIIAILCAVFALISSSLFAKGAEIAEVKVQDGKEIFRNGDVVNLTGSGFAALDEVYFVTLTLINDQRHIVGHVALTDYQLGIDANGQLSGSVTLKEMSAEATSIEVLVYAKNSNTRGSNWLKIEGEERYNKDGNGVGQLTAGTVVVTDDGSQGGAGNNDGIAQVSEDLDLSGSGWTGTLFAVAQREYSDVNGQELLFSSPLSSANASLVGGNLTGFTTTTATYLAGTHSIRIGVTNNAVETTDSNVLLIPDATQPTISSAAAIALDTIQVVFDEEVIETGDATARFSFSGTDATGLSVAALVSADGDTSTTWNLALNTDLPDGSPDLTVTYNTDAGALNMLADVFDNQVTDGSNVAVDDSVGPNAPTMTNPGNLTLMDGASVALTATADDGTTDPSMASVRFEGSDDLLSWTDLGSDTDVSDATYSVTHTFGTQFAYYRAVTIDASGNETPGTETVDLSDGFRVEITSFVSPVAAGVRSQFTIEIQNNYAIATTVGINLNFDLTSDQGTGSFFNVATGGTAVSSINITSGNSTVDFWYEDSDDNTTPTITVTEAAANLGDNTDSQQITISASAIADFLVTTANSENETAGTAFDITVTARQGDGSTATDYVGAQTLTWATTATNAPDGTAAIIPADGDYTFTAGVLTVSAGGTLFNSSETPTITVTQGATLTTTALGAGAGVTVADGADAEVRIKTADETADGEYDNNVLDATELQGPTQGAPSSLNVFGVVYDDFGNLKPDVAGTWTADASLDGTFSLGGSQVNNTFTFDGLSNAGTVYTGVITFDIGGGITDNSGTITVDDNQGATVTAFTISTDPDDNEFVFANWSGTSSGDDGTTGTPSSFEIRWTDEANGQIDTEVEWDAATSVGTSGIPAFSAGTWRIDMSGFVAGNKFFAIRTFDNVNNISALATGAFTTDSDFSLPVTLTSFAAIADFDRVVVEWRTSSEINNEGFFLYRSEDEAGPFQPLNIAIIPGKGNTTEATVYEFADDNVETNTTYYYKITSRDFDGTVHEFSQIVSAAPKFLPERFELAQNFPNPFNPSTQFSFTMARTAKVNLAIYNLLGQKIYTVLENEQLDPGVYEQFSWNATDNNGQPVSNGIYYMVLTVNEFNFSQVRKMVYVR